MARGLFSGLVFGSVLAVVGLGAVSLLSPLPQSPDVGGDPDGVSAPVEAAGDTRPAGGKDADLVEAAPKPPAPDAGGDSLSALDGADTDPAARPAVGGASAGIQDPGSDGQAPTVGAGGDTAVGTGQPGDAPAAPASDSRPEGADTAPGAKPDVGGATGGLDNPAAAGSAPDVSGVSDRPAAPAQPGGGLNTPQGGDQPISAEPAQPSAPEVGDAASGFGTTPGTGEASPEVAAGTDTEVDGTGPASAIADPAQAGQSDSAPSVASEAPAQPAPRVAALPQSGGEEPGAEEAEDTGPTIGTRVKPLTERDDRSSSRLPSVSGASQEPGEPQEPAIRRYAVAFENPEKKALMSIVLIDDTGAFGAEALQEFPYPLTFALDPNDPDAVEKLARHRAAGFEVALLVDLPEAAAAQDAEVALGAALDALPETVALIEGVGSGVQGNRPLSDQVTAIAGGTGRGFVTQSNGLNTVQKLAARKGVPSAVVFRDFDGAGQTPDTIRRFLDQAAFRADQDGAVVMLGRVRPDTISALLLWGLQDRASRVALAPLSAALLRDAAE